VTGRPVPRYPVYIISKGRSDCCLTARALTKDGVPFRLVVEPQERGLYAEEFGEGVLEVLPFSNLGLGSIPARNWVWEHAKAAGAERHWILDDNIDRFWRRWKARRFRCDSGVALRVAEDFVDRYENVAIGGLNYYMFSPNRVKQAPFFINVHVYSCLLIRCDLPQRWRGRYNEDTDLCLQVLSAGWCTVLINAFLAEKTPTMTMKGGNMTELYKGDGRLKMARSLERLWPGVVETKRRFQRPQHVVKAAWGKFDTPLRRKPGLDLSALPATDEYGMELRQLGEVKSPEIRQLIAGRVRPAPRAGKRAPAG
jgi:hypothetical protein